MASLSTTNEKGNAALTAAGVARRQLVENEDAGGLLVALGGSLIGVRSKGDAAADSRLRLEAAVQRAITASAAISTKAAEAQIRDLVIMVMETVDIVEGRGERALFVWLFLELTRHVPDIMLALLPMVPHYGSWRVLSSLYLAASGVDSAVDDEEDGEQQEGGPAAAAGEDNPAPMASAAGDAAYTASLAKLKTAIVRMWAGQLLRDEARLGAHEAKVAAAAEAAPPADAAAGGAPAPAPAPRARLSLAGKWAPRVGKSIDRACGLGKATADDLSRLRAAKAAAAAAHALAEVQQAQPEDEDDMEVEPPALALEGDALAAAPVAGTFHLRAYRKLTSRLSSYLGVVEQAMCAGQWAGIVPEHVPSKANKKYKKALLNAKLQKGWARDAAKDHGKRGGLETKGQGRRSEDVDRVAAAANVHAAAVRSMQAGSAKRLKGARLQPHEVVGEYMRWDAFLASGRAMDGMHLPTDPEEADPMVEAMWADLVGRLKTEKAEGVKEKEAAAVAVAAGGAAAAPAPIAAPKPASAISAAVAMSDVSGSMEGLPMLVSVSLGLLIAQLQKEGSPWAGKVLTFESNPQWCDVSDCKDLFSAVQKLRAASWGGNTNLNAAMSLLLSTLTASGIPPDSPHVPRWLLIFSDMQFDEARGVVPEPQAGAHGAAAAPAPAVGVQAHPDALPALPLLKDTRAAWLAAGYAPPTIVFWNLRDTGSSFQVDSSEEGVALMSGFSQAQLKALMEGQALAEMVDEAAAEAGAELAAEAAGGAAGGDPVAPKAKGPRQPTPWEVLRAKLDSPRYERVRAALARPALASSLTAAADRLASAQAQAKYGAKAAGGRA